MAWWIAGPSAPAGAAPAADPAAQLFVDQCSACHTIGGGKLVGLDLAEVAAWPDENLRTGVKSMEGYVGPLADEQVEQLVAFLKDPKNKDRVAAAEARAAATAPAPATPKPAVKPPTTPAKPPAAKSPQSSGGAVVPMPSAPSPTPPATTAPAAPAPTEPPAAVTAPAAPPLNATPLPTAVRPLALPFGRLEIAVLIIGFVVLIAAFVIVTDTITSGRATGAAGPDTLLTARRHLLKGMFGIIGAAVLLSLGVFDKLARFYQGPRITREEESAHLDRTLQRLRLTEAQQQLELERLRQDYIVVARLGDLKPSQGLYFIDYALRPAMAFRGADGLPWLLSAKCTHLGCTVKASVNAQGQLGCPCHFSLFDVRTGVPTPQSVAKAPLPVLGWALLDDQDRVVVSRSPKGELTGQPDPALLDGYRVCIAKQFAAAEA